MDEKRRASGQKLLDAALEYWQACHDEFQDGSVQWLEGSNGELLIFTRFEYKRVLMQNIDKLPSSVVHRFGESLAIDEDEDE